MSQSLNDAFIEAFEGRDWERARALVLQRMGAADADIAEGQGWLGIVAAAAGDVARAQQHLERAISLACAAADPWAQLAGIVRSDDPERAVELWQGAIRRDSQPRYHLGLARCLEEDLGEFQSAREHLGIAAQDEHLAPEALARLVSVSASLGDGAGAQEAARRLMHAEHSDPSALGHAISALAELSSGPTSLLESLAQRFETLHGTNLAVGVVMVDRALADGDLSLARQRAEALDSTFPERAAPKLLLAEIELREGKVDHAFQRMDALGGDVPTRLWLRLATACAEGDDLGRAHAIVSDVVAEHPEHVEALLLGARVALARDDEEEADALFARARLLDEVIDETAAKTGRTVAGIVAALEERWPDASIEHLQRGHNAFVARVVRGGRTEFLKLYADWHRPKDSVDAEVALLSEIGGSRPSGLQIIGVAAEVAVPGWRGFSSAALPGEALAEREIRSGLSPTRTAAIGRALADLHAAFDAVSPTWERHLGGSMAMGAREVFHWANSGEGAKGLHAALSVLGLEHHPRAEDIATMLVPALERIEALGALPRGIVHGDFAPHNLLWDGDEVVGVLDFDYATQDVVLADLANTLARTAFSWSNLMVAGTPAPRIDAGKALVTAYMEARGQGLPRPQALVDVILATRVSYCLNMARAGRRATLHRSPDRYPAPEHAITVLARQVAYLTSEDARAAASQMLS